MISFKTKKETIASVALIFGVVLLLVSFVFMLLPKPQPANTRTGINTKLTKLRIETKDARKKTAEIKAEIAPLLWQGDPATVSPAALNALTQMAAKYRVKLVTFRPQRALDDQGLTQLPFTVALDGPYPAILAMVQELEAPTSRFVVSVFQANGADGATDRVTATIGAVAYLEPAKKETTTSGKKN